MRNTIRTENIYYLIFSTPMILSSERQGKRLADNAPFQ